MLQGLGHDAVTARESGWANKGTGDPEILRVAIADGRAVLTRNRRHFMRLHMQQPNHSGIIVCTADSNFEGQA